MKTPLQNFTKLTLKISPLSLLLCSSFACAQSADTFPACLNGLQNAALQAGVSSQNYQRFTHELKADLSILEKLQYQPEFKQPIWDYIAALVDDQRIREGQMRLKQHHTVLKRIQAQYGVDPATVVAVWGVESNYGQNFGSYPLVQALGTLSCYGRRQNFFRKEFFASLRILQAGDINPEHFKGSWAGAFGHTQFMPTTFERLAVDFDGDGKRDLIDNTGDALASTANYLRKSGWQTGQPWGFEVQLPANFNSSVQGRRNKQTIQYWQSKGITNIYMQPLTTQANANQKAGLFLPAGVRGPAFLVFKNFDVIYSYNAAESYALAIAHLADRLLGQADFVTPWPTDDLGLSRAQRIELQNLLLRRGYDIGPADGMIGIKTRDALKQEEARLGLPKTGRAGEKILRAMQKN